MHHRFGGIVAVIVLAGCGDGQNGSNDMNAGGSGGGDMSATAVKLSGAVQKGPFVLGSTINVSPVDAVANPTGQVFSTQTTDDLGDFSIELAYRGRVSIEGNGYYYNEITGKLSASQLTLRAFYDVTATGAQQAYVNIVTHLTYGRIKTLLAAGQVAADGGSGSVVEQAERELRTALGVGGSNFDPKKPGVGLDLLGGDDDGDAYLFAVSAILAEIAKDNAAGGSIDAALQELINTTSSSFATSGTLDAALVTQIKNVQIAVDPHDIMKLLAARLTAVGSTATVPDLTRVWDADGDGVPDKVDNCPLIADPSQQPVNGICKMRRVDNTNVSQYGGVIALGDFTGDGKLDLVSILPGGFTVYPGDGGGSFTGTGIATTPAQSLTGNAFWGFAPLVADVDGDGKLDLVLNSGTGASASGATTFWPGDGAGHFGSPVLVFQGGATLPQNATGSFDFFTIGDFDGDGKNDFAGSVKSVSTYQTDDQVYIATNDGSGGWTPTQVPNLAGGTGNCIAVMNVVAGLFDADTKSDLAVVGGSAGVPQGGGSGYCIGGVTIVLGSSVGGTHTNYLPNSNYFNAAVGQFNYTSDHFADLFLTAGSDVGVLTGNGDGTFATTIINGGNGGPLTSLPRPPLVVADFTGDGNDDAAVLTTGGGASQQLGVAVLVSGGTQFGSTSTYFVPGYSASMVRGGKLVSASGSAGVVLQLAPGSGSAPPMLENILFN